MGSSRRRRWRILFWLAFALIAALFALLPFLGMATPPGAPKGTPTRVAVEAFYVDGASSAGQGGKRLGVNGVVVTFDDGEGSSGTIITSTLADGAPKLDDLEMLSGHTYTITATFNSSVQSTQATVNAYRAGYLRSGYTRAGWINVWVRDSDGQIVNLFHDQSPPVRF